jgi:hypothetical protein
VAVCRPAKAEQVYIRRYKGYFACWRGGRLARSAERLILQENFSFPKSA